MQNGRALGLRRLLAFGVDWLVIATWGGLLFGAVMIATDGHPPRPENPWTAQGIGLLTMTLPVTLYFTLCEASAIGASLGKRLLGLVVTRDSGGRLTFGSALMRNGLKFVPWECGHLVAQQAIFSGDAGFPAWVWGFAVTAFAVPVWWVVALITTGEAPYDRWTRCRVVAGHLQWRHRRVTR